MTHRVDFYQKYPAVPNDGSKMSKMRYFYQKLFKIEIFEENQNYFLLNHEEKLHFKGVLKIDKGSKSIFKRFKDHF